MIWDKLVYILGFSSNGWSGWEDEGLFPYDLPFPGGLRMGLLVLVVVGGLQQQGGQAPCTLKRYS